VTQAPTNSVSFQLRAGCALQDGDWRHHPNGFISLFEIRHDVEHLYVETNSCQ
jgi:hypothetical protein